MMRRLTALAGALCLVAVGAGVVAAGALAAPAAHWTVRALSLSSRFTKGAEKADQYTILVTNTGAASSKGEPVVVSSAISSTVKVTSITAKDWASGEEPECTMVPLRCVDPGPVTPDDTIEIIVTVNALTESGVAVNTVNVAGGGASPASVRTETPVSSEPVPFGIQDFAFTATSPEGTEELQAAGHPYEQTTSFELLSNENKNAEERYRPAKNPRDIAITLPDGFVGNPLVAPRCPVSALEGAGENEQGETVAPCPKGSRIGLVTLVDGGGVAGTLKRTALITPLYNLTPEAGHPAEFGFSYAHSYAIVFYADLVHTSAGYRLRVTVPGTPIIDLDGVVVTIFGDPGARNAEPAATGAFLTNPARCSGEPQSTKLEMDSWEAPHEWLSAESVSYPSISGCELLRFDPAFAMTPEQTPASPAPGAVRVDSPDGYEIDLKIPRAESPWSLLSSPELKGATITLPPGLSISPSAANGLEGCQATGPNGIQIPHGTAHPDEAGEGEAIGPGGLSYLTPGHCPEGSQIGEVEVNTPLLEKPVTGGLFLATPGCGGEGSPPCTEAQAENGEMVKNYIEVKGSGVDVKLQGTVEVGGHGPHSQSTDLQPGQLRVGFLENPQLPVSEIKVKLDGGPRAPLASPQSCGAATTTTLLEPWSTAAQNAEPSSTFSVLGCGASEPFAPSFTAGTLVPLAGSSSPFTMTLSRQDGEQNLAAFTFTTPPGLRANLSSVSPCEEPHASKGECGPESLIGEATIAVGAGLTPYWVNGGRVYLTGSHNGGPFGLSIVVPAVVRPFNLGTVVVGAAIAIDPMTAALTITTDPLPQIIDGIPLRIRTLNVNLDRPGFIFNPTNCTPLAVNATIMSANGASAPVSARFQAGGCRALPFGPKLTALTYANGEFAGHGASLHVKITTAQGQANMRSLKIDLPQRLPARLETIQKACPEKVFKVNPAACPSASIIGSATVATPVLNEAMRGPAILVSHGGRAFPDMVLVLQAEGVRIDLTGALFVDQKNITSTTFRTIPDVPIRRLDLVLPEGKSSVLAASASLCAGGLHMLTAITGQNGGRVKPIVKVAVAGCKHRKKALTRAQKLAKALKACHKKVRHVNRKKCEKEARAKYGPRSKKAVRKK